MTWTHCSVPYEVTWDKTARVRADAPLRPRGHRRVRSDIGLSAQTRSSPCPRPPSEPLARPARAGYSVRADAARTREKNKK
jgi:hypothetical protein